MAATQEELIAGIAEIIEEVTGIEPSEVTMEKSFVDDLDIDSLSMVEIAVQTEDKYGVKIPDEDLAGLRTKVAAAPDGLLDLRRQLSRLGAPRTRSRWMNKGLGRQPIVVAGPRQDSGHRKAWYCMGIQYCTSPAELPRGR